MKTKILFLFSVCAGIISIGSCALPAKNPSEDIPSLPHKFTKFTLKAECTNDHLLTEIKIEAKNKSSILHLLKLYFDEYKNDPRPESPALVKLEKLFACGLANDQIEGHHYGITAILKLGDHPFGGFLNQLWGVSLGDVSPWDGKTFTAAGHDELSSLTQGFERGAIPTYLGINCFKEYDESFLNSTSIAVLNFWFELKDVSQLEHDTYGYDMKGGHFIARRAKSIDTNNWGNDVLQLNYRWKNLNNPVPLKYLIDEVVQIAEGLYLGPLLFATQRLLEEYDPKVLPAEYKYENFGYFLLMDESWNNEKQRLFP